MYKANDYYAQKAKKLGFKARSAFKLQEIQAQHRLLAKGDRVLDLGSAPGSWLQLALKIIGSTGSIMGIDLTAIHLPPSPNLTIIKGSVFEFANIPDFAGLCFDVVLSDMAPNTTGIRSIDQSRSFELTLAAWEIARKRLLSGGNFCAKVFESPQVAELEKAMKNSFRQTHRIRPQSTQKSSTEIFLVGKGFCAQPKSGKPTLNRSKTPQAAQKPKPNRLKPSRLKPIDFCE